MRLELAKALLKEIAAEDIAQEITLHAMGEPLLHPGLEEVIATASELGLDTVLFTNMVLLTSERAESILKAGLTHLHLSVQSKNEESNRAKFSGPTLLSYEEYQERVVEAISMKIKHGLPKKILKIRHQFHLSNEKARASALSSVAVGGAFHSIREIEDALEPYSNAVARLTGTLMKEPKEWTREWDRRGPYHAYLHDGIEFQATVVLTWGNSLRDQKPIPAKIGWCRSVIKKEHIAVSWDGKVAFCCSDYDFKTSVGRVTSENSLLRVLESHESKRFHQTMRLGLLRNARCQECLGSYSRSTLLTRNALSLFHPIAIEQSY